MNQPANQPSNQPAQQDPDAAPAGNNIYTNRRYQLMLTVAAVMFLVTLTLSVTAIIITRDESDEREAAFEVTLTAVYERLQQSLPGQVDLSNTPQDASPPVYREYPFAPAANAPAYAAAESCDQQTISSTVRDQNGTLTDALNVVLWGDYTDPQIVLTGDFTGQDAGQWTITLENAINRRLFVQLVAAGRYVSAPVELIFEAGDCARNHATIDFTQTAPFE